MDSEVFGDFKNWCAISCPVEGLRFDRRTLELLDSDGDGHIRTPEVVAAVEYMKSKGVAFEDLAAPGEDCETKLADVISRQKDLANLAPTAEEAKAFADWQEKGKCPQVAFLGESTKAAEASLAAVESVIDAFFTPAEDLPLVTEEQDAELPLYERLNPKFAEAIADFAEKCVKPVCGEETKTLTRAGWKRVKNAFAEYRAWVAAEPVKNALAKAGLEDEERFLRFRMHLWEFLENYCTMDRLYSADEMAVFQMGVLRIDGREMSLCFHVANEAQHSALAGKSDCCVIYLKLSRPGEKAACGICAVVTAGNVSPLYVGRNGVFYDRDGKDWEAVVTKVVENQVSLAEAFWMPWKKVGAGIAGAVKKFLGDKQSAGERNLSSLTAKVPEDAKNKSGGNGSVAMASSLAAIGVSVGLVGAALASVMAAVRDFAWWQYPLSVLVAILVVSLPSVVLTYFKLRRRDLGAILNASGWAVNRKLYFSMKLAAGFTKCARRKCRCALWWWLFAVLAVGIAAAALWRWHCGCCCA